MKPKFLSAQTIIRLGLISFVVCYQQLVYSEQDQYAGDGSDTEFDTLLGISPEDHLSMTIISPLPGKLILVSKMLWVMNPCIYGARLDKTAVKS